MRSYLAECLGTFALIFCGTGAIVADHLSGGSLGHLGISITFGLLVMSLIYSFGAISGAHFNPAVSIAFTLAKRFPKERLPGYITAQVLGAILASGALKLLFPDQTAFGATVPSGTYMQSFILEVILTFFLMLVIFQVATGSKEQGMFAGIAIGGMVTMASLFAGPICGASMNPARSIGPGLISGQMNGLWIYMTAPCVGAALATLAWKYFSAAKHA
jgi:aquaporin Z